MMDTRTFIFFVMMCFLSVQSQDNIFTITPNNFVCIGESVIITCYLYPHTANGYNPFALLSVNGSNPEVASSINNIYGHLGYVATVAIPLMGDSARIQLTITSFQVSDSNTVFGCHAQLAIDGSDTGVIESGTASLAAPPSPPINLTAGYNSPTCSGTIQLAWTPGASDRDIEMYFLSLNGSLIASLGPSERNDTQMLILQRDTEYTYSVVAMSCAGNSTHTYADTISIGNPPSSPVVTFSQTDFSCSNVLMWPSPASDRSITSYSISRDAESIADNVPHTATAYTDSYEDIDTTYRYSVVAISCAGNSTSIDVNSPRIERTSLATDPPLTIRYDNTTNELFVDWTLNLSQLISVTYNLGLVYNYTQNNETDPYNETEIFSQESTDTDYTQNLTRPTSLFNNESVEFVITATLRITQQCNTIITDGIELTATIDSKFTPPPTTDFPVVAIFGIAVVVIVGCLFCAICALILIGVTIVYVSKKDPKRRSDSQELQEQMYSQINKGNKTSKQQPVEEKMEGLYAEMDHTLTKPDNLKRPEPVEEILYSQVQQPMDGPNQ